MSQATPTSIPYNGSGTINIHINNPSANVAPAGMPVYNPYAYAYPPAMSPGYAYPPNYYINNSNNVNGVPTPQNTQPQVALGSAPITPPLAAPVAPAEAKKKREVVMLTDNYIKALEKSLKDTKPEVRKDGASELLKRFKEDKSRVSDPALTALLNIALQDKNQAVKAIAIATIQTGYAKGDNLTKQILSSIENSNSNYGQDSNQSISAALKLAEEKQTMDDNSHYDPNQEVKKKSKGQ